MTVTQVLTCNWSCSLLGCCLFDIFLFSIYFLCNITKINCNLYLSWSYLLHAIPLHFIFLFEGMNYLFIVEDPHATSRRRTGIKALFLDNMFIFVLYRVICCHTHIHSITPYSCMYMQECYPWIRLGVIVHVIVNLI